MKKLPALVFLGGALATPAFAQALPHVRIGDRAIGPIRTSDRAAAKSRQPSTRLDGPWSPATPLLASLRGNAGRTATTEPHAPCIDSSEMNGVRLDPDRRQSDQAALYFRVGHRWRFASKDDRQRAIAGDQMTKKQLARQRERVATQMRWAVVHGGDPELLDLLRFESDRLFAMVAQSFPRRGGAVVIDATGQPRS
jgi:hypothetical protein